MDNSLSYFTEALELLYSNKEGNDEKIEKLLEKQKEIVKIEKSKRILEKPVKKIEVFISL